MMPESDPDLYSVLEARPSSFSLGHIPEPYQVQWLFLCSVKEM